MVIKSNGEEVGRISANAKNAEEHITELTSIYGDVEITYEKVEGIRLVL